jgi:beta-aspartyl-peptidase (threonine type)
MTSQPAIIVHGGAGFFPDEQDQAVQIATRHAASIGWQILRAGGSALDAVEKAVNSLEDDPLFDAGYGSVLNRMGEVEMDALIVDGSKHDFGAVAGVKHIRYPISLARRVMHDSPHCFLIGNGADEFGKEQGLPYVPNNFFITPHEFDNFRQQHPSPVKGTVGAVALDTQGQIACATSTGGVPNKMPGRVGDSPLFGAGGYADSRYGGASATGVGENIMRVLLCKYAVDQLAAGMTAQAAADASIAYINGFYEHSECGIIVADRQGNVGTAHSTIKIAVGWINPQGEPQALMRGGIR